MTATTGNLIARRSIEVLERGQAPSGAFIASPSFPTYHYAWLRDGAFCAHALDLVGEAHSAAAFHSWAGRSIEAHRSMIESAIAQVGAGLTPRPEEMPPARYTLEGSLEQPEDEPWPNFQIDGYGMWLWAFERHVRDGSPTGAQRATVELVARYLKAAWRLKCCSCWEELQTGEHTSTLAASFAGLSSAARLLDDARWGEEAVLIREALTTRFMSGGYFGRAPGDARVDGSLVWLSVPFGVLPADDRRIVETIEAIKRDLIGPSGGVYRYLGDTYYGGGEWLLLTSSLAWHEELAGNGESGEALRAWVRGQASPNGDLSEQITTHAQEAEMVEPWVERWGPVASPLLWSHAMFLISEAAAR